MARTVQISSVMVSPVPGDDSCFIVEAMVASNRTWVFHNGPVSGAAFFTEEEAVRLAAKVRYAGMIDPSHWEPVSRSWDEIEEDWAIDAQRERIAQMAY